MSDDTAALDLDGDIRKFDLEYSTVGQPGINILKLRSSTGHVTFDPGFGNTASAGAASVLSMQWEKWTSADDVAVVGVGAGLTWASYLLRFGDEA